MESPLKRLNILKRQIVPNPVDESSGKMHVEIKEDIRTAILTWDFPMTLNALSEETLTPLIENLNAFESDPKIGCVILTGTKNTF